MELTRFKSRAWTIGRLSTTDCALFRCSSHRQSGSAIKFHFHTISSYYTHRVTIIDRMVGKLTGATMETGIEDGSVVDEYPSLHLACQIQALSQAFCTPFLLLLLLLRHVSSHERRRASRDGDHDLHSVLHLESKGVHHLHRS